MSTSYSLLPILVLAVAAILTIVLVLIIKNRKAITNEEIITPGVPDSMLEDLNTAGKPNRVYKLALKSVGYNLLGALLLASPLLFLKDNKNDGAIVWLFVLLVVGPLSLLTQLIMGIVWASGTRKKELGKGMLLAVGLFLLIGLLTCSPFLFRFGF
jgi:hypothetical protein